jgi:hypothetical protein
MVGTAAAASQSLRVRCDPADPRNLHFNSRSF